VTSDEGVLHVLDALNELKIQYVISGSLASNVYGIARLTRDAEIVLVIEGSQLTELARRWPSQLHLDPR